MDIKKLEKAASYFAQIQMLDKQIIELDKFAMLVANGVKRSLFELKVEKLDEDKDDKVRFDEDGSLVNGLTDVQKMINKYTWFNPIGIIEDKKKDDGAICLSQDIYESTTLEILGILLRDLNLKRGGLLQKLERIGVKS